MKIRVNSKLLDAPPNKHKEHYREILIAAGVWEPSDEISFDPEAKVFTTKGLERPSGWGPDDPHHIACVDGCHAMFELAFNACMAQGGTTCPLHRIQFMSQVAHAGHNVWQRFTRVPIFPPKNDMARVGTCQWNEMRNLIILCPL